MNLKQARKQGLLRWMYFLFLAYAYLYVEDTPEEINRCAFCEYETAHFKCPLDECGKCCIDHECCFGDYKMWLNSEWDQDEQIKYAARILDRIENLIV